MKTLYKIILFIIVFSFYINAQIDTTSLSYYPLNDGDYWEYEIVTTDYSVFPFMLYRDYFSHEVIGDTVFPKNNKYKIIKIKKLRTTQSPFYMYEKVDSISCNVFRYDSYFNVDVLIDSLKSQSGDSSKAARTFPFEGHHTICKNILQDSILNNLTNSKNLEEQHWHSPIEYKLSKGFGLTYLTYYFDFGTFTQHLLYARIDGIEYGTQVNSIPEENNPVSKEFHLFQIYPNPFNLETNIQFSIPKTEYITLKIYNLRGQEVATLESAGLNAGIYKYTWDASGLTSGVYIIRLQSNHQSKIKKCLFIK